MRLLLDTHIFIWWTSAPQRLSSHALALCADSTNQLLLSVASIWEMQIKLQLGKLKLTLPLQQLVVDQQQRNGMVVLPIESAHVFALQRLPTHHNDPFDRLLIARALVEDLKLLSVDNVFTAYPVAVLG